MPCHDPGPSSWGSEYQAHLDELTDMLCALLRSDPKLVRKHPKLADWWKRHQMYDEAKELREKAAALESKAKIRRYRTSGA